MAAAVLRPDETPGKLCLCYRCRERKPRDRFGPPRRPDRETRAPWCHACRERSDAAHERRCKRCGVPVPPGYVGRLCPECDRARKRRLDATRTPEQRQAGRQRVAERKGRPFAPGGLPWFADQPRLFSGTDESAWRSIEVANAWQAWAWWLARAPAWWTAARARHLRWQAAVQGRLNDARVEACQRALVSAEAIARELRRPACPYCGVRLDESNVSLDHMEPIALGGQHVEANLLGACLPCNMRKNAKPFVVWLGMLAEPYRSRCRELHALRLGDGRQGCLL
jgi:hypothetical protein